MTAEQELKALRDAAAIIESLLTESEDDVDSNMILSNARFYLGSEAEELNLYLASMLRP